MSGGRAWRATPADLCAVLSAPLGPETAVSVPVSMQKHLMPFGRWGCVATDNILLPWAGEQAQLFGVYRELVAAGFNGAAIGEAAPRWQPLRRCDADTRARVLARWSMLDPWRRARQHLDVAARACRREKKENGNAGDDDADSG